MVQFAVTQKDGEWTVFRDGEVVTAGMSRSRAIEQAQMLAHDAKEAGEGAEVLVQDYTGELTTRRTF
ncbi:MAG TPA: DUF2188 domain-containing protein [Caulobacteraceae bacterium]|nr:DUF2188 domain-containing protein [Caulobacteraceae bacterium]